MLKIGLFLYIMKSLNNSFHDVQKTMQECILVIPMSKGDRVCIDLGHDLDARV